MTFLILLQIIIIIMHSILIYVLVRNHELHGSSFNFIIHYSRSKLWQLIIGTPNYGCNGYLCDDRSRCLSHTSVCNGYTSCSDGSDEENCCKMYFIPQILMYFILIWKLLLFFLFKTDPPTLLNKSVVQQDIRTAQLSNFKKTCMSYFARTTWFLLDSSRAVESITNWWRVTAH